MLRRIAHSAHHRGQLSMFLRLTGDALHSIYGPTADTGGLFQNGAGVVYRARDLDDILTQLRDGLPGTELPGPGPSPVTERPDPAPSPG
ncbi:MAG: hypothetical protein H6807_15455 [Planctomycetes bacterium]|nr:hypothetical protein [Planctomycetota bacterium]